MPVLRGRAEVLVGVLRGYQALQRLGELGRVGRWYKPRHITGGLNLSSSKRHESCWVPNVRYGR